MIRIVGGRWRGRTLKVPDGPDVRPTADRVREAWMSIVNARVPGARVLDLFAGSGALGLEALSRGAAHATLVDNAPGSLRAIQDNVELLGAGDRVIVERMNALRFIETLASGAYDLGFVDPPYRKGLAAEVAEQWLATPFATLIGIEHQLRDPMPAGGILRKYGSTAITFYETE